MTVHHCIESRILLEAMMTFVLMKHSEPAIADRCRIVDDQRFLFNPLQQMGGRDIANVKRRILTHQNDIDIAAEIQLHGLAKCKMIAFDLLNRDRPGLCDQTTICQQGQLFLFRKILSVRALFMLFSEKRKIRKMSERNYLQKILNALLHRFHQ